MTLIGIVFTITTLFGQTFIGMDKKDVMKDIKVNAKSIGKPEKDDRGYYSITAKFDNNTNMYSFTDEDMCYFYMIMEYYSLERYNFTLNYYDQNYLRIYDDRKENKFDNTVTIWKEPKGETLIYRWIVVNYNTGVMYTLYLTKENYENNKYSYLKSLLGS
jgi:hypothetical protein